MKRYVLKPFYVGMGECNGVDEIENPQGDWYSREEVDAVLPERDNKIDELEDMVAGLKAAVESLHNILRK